MRVPQPFLPLRCDSSGGCHTVHILERDYTFGPNGLITSIRSQGHELLAAPMRIVAREEGQPSRWDTDYPNNESESFIQHRSDQQITLCGAMQSERFIVDVCSTVDFDGSIDIDLKLMTRGQTVAQCFGIADLAPKKYLLDQLWLEVPLRGECVPCYHMYPNGEMYLADGTVREENRTSTSGRIPEQTCSLPFKPLLWLGDEERGLGWFAESDRNWQPDSPEKALELVRQGDTLLLRVHLLDGQPTSWKGDAADGMNAFFPLGFSFGFQATPVKPFPRQPYIHNAFHLDCGIKIKGNYRDFLEDQSRFDLLAEKGVTTLILHEKWNKSQNWFRLSEYTAGQLRYICDECHKRGIKVLPYFGYEISTMSDQWNAISEKVLVKDQSGKNMGGWWRVPFQRDYVVCYNSDYQDMFIDGIADIMDTYHVDGVYLDSTSLLRCCCNTEHGCGWYDEKGVLHGTYGVKALRRLFKRLYDVVEPRGGEINLHSFAAINFTVLPYIHQSWLGENLQFAYMTQGLDGEIDLDYFRTEYTGRNMGVPVEFIAYANPPIWTFREALALALIHGILPRPNDIGYPLELMSGVWKAFDAFPIDKSQWLPYWKNRAETGNRSVKVSYYRYTALSGSQMLLAFAVNLSGEPVEGVTLRFPEPVTRGWDAITREEVGLTLDLEKFGYRILCVE